MTVPVPAPPVLVIDNLPIRRILMTVLRTDGSDVIEAQYDLEVRVAQDGRAWLATDDTEDGSRTPLDVWLKDEAGWWAPPNGGASD